MDYFYVIRLGKKYALYKIGNTRNTRVYKDGLEMRQDISFYLVNCDCRIAIHNKDGTVDRVIVSKNTEDK